MSAPISPRSERIVVCPRCQGDSVYATHNPSRPFCSERCKNLDFSAWASENYRIEAAPNTDEILGACRTWGVEAKFDPSEDSFCRVCSPIAEAMGQKAGEKWTAAVKLQPTLPKSDRLLEQQETPDTGSPLAPRY